MIKITDLAEGMQVTYIPFEGCDPSLYEHGVIKALSPKKGYVFVVFHCNNDWDNYDDYTSQSTSLDNLVEGWI